MVPEPDALPEPDSLAEPDEVPDTDPLAEPEPDAAPEPDAEELTEPDPVELALTECDGSPPELVEVEVEVEVELEVARPSEGDSGADGTKWRKGATRPCRGP